jgi:hypothetical protein
MLIKLQMGITTRLGHRVARYLGFNQKDGEADAQILKRKDTIVRILLSGGDAPDADREIYDACEAIGAVLRDALSPILARRRVVEREMERLARRLPAHEFVAGVRGFGDKAFAILVSETGDLSDGTRYSTPEKLWKRLGLAPFNGMAYSQWRRKGGLTAEEWTQAGYVATRLAEVRACIGEPMAKVQLVAAAKSETEYGQPAGPYGEIYVRRRERTAITHPDWPKAHARADALRVMEKAVIRDLWKFWRRDGSQI